MSLPFSHPYLHENVKFKKDKKQKIGSFLWQEKHKPIEMEKFAVKKSNRISIYKAIFQQKPTFFHLDSQKRSVENNESINFSQTTRNYVLNGFWL